MTKIHIFIAMAKQFIPKGRNLLPITSRMNYVTNAKGTLCTVTDLARHFSFTLPDKIGGHGLVDVAALVKTGNWETAKTLARREKFEEFPQWPESEVVADMPGNILHVPGIEQVGVTADNADVTARSVLRYVYFDHKLRNAVATEGYRLRMRQNLPGFKKSFLIDPLTLKNAVELHNAGFPITRVKLLEHVFDTGKKDDKGEKVMSKFCYTWVDGEGWTMLVKVDNTPYPKYPKVCPKITTSGTVWTPDIQELITRVIDQALPLINQRTFMMMASRNCIMVRNIENEVANRYEFSREIFPLKDIFNMSLGVPGDKGGTDGALVGFNAKYLREAIPFHAGQDITFRVGVTQESATTMISAGRYGLLMPVRILEGNSVAEFRAIPWNVIKV